MPPISTCTGLSNASYVRKNVAIFKHFFPEWNISTVVTFQVFAVGRNAQSPFGDKVCLERRPRRVDKEGDEEDEGYNGEGQKDDKETGGVEFAIRQGHFCPLVFGPVENQVAVGLIVGFTVVAARRRWVETG